jgi:hypothetical protein
MILLDEASLAGCSVMAEMGETACPWRARDGRGWREDVLVAVSADLIESWYTACLTTPHITRGRGGQRFGGLIAEVRAARLSGDGDRLEAACRAVVAAGADQPSPTEALREPLGDLADLFSRSTVPGVCLIGCHRCENSIAE